jgi:hypothetical protein
MITNDARAIREIKSGTAIINAAFHTEKALFISKFYLNLRKKLVRCYIQKIALYNAVTLTFRKVGQK